MINFIKQWDPGMLSNLVGTVDATVFGWYSETSPFTHLIFFKPPETTDEPFTMDNYKLKLACHLLVDAFPEQGLPELCDSMKDIYKFYWNRRATPVLPETVVHSLPATRGGVYTRPEFQYGEE